MAARGGLFSAISLVCAFLVNLGAALNETEFCDVLSNTTCSVSKIKTIDSNFTLRKSKVELANMVVTPSKWCVYKSCIFRIEADTLTLNNVSISSSILELSISKFVVCINTSLSADYGVNQGLGWSQSEQDIKGNAYAAWGSSCLPSSTPKFYGDPRLLHNASLSEIKKLNITGMAEGINSTYLFLGSGASMMFDDYFGNGGGRVVLNTTDLMVDGFLRITANGSPQDSSENICLNRPKASKTNAGTGGYIFFGVNGALSTKQNVEIRVEALGGNYCQDSPTTTKLGGSGGRVILDVDEERNNIDSKLQIRVRGGLRDPSINDTNLISFCRNGGAGTVYFVRNETLLIDNNFIKTETCTNYPNGPKTVSLQIVNGARVCPWLFDRPESREIIESNEILIKGGILSYQTNTGILNISAQTLVIEGEGGIGKSDLGYKLGLLYVQVEELILSSNASVLCKNLTIIKANRLLLEENSEIYSMSSLMTELIIHVYDNFTLSKSSVQASKISIRSATFLLDAGLLRATQVTCMAYDTNGGSKKMLVPIPFLQKGLSEAVIKNILNSTATTSTTEFLRLMVQTNYTLYILAKAVQIGTATSVDPNNTADGRLEAARIGVFSENLFVGINGYLRTDGMGCLKGPGQGVWDDLFKCGGTGGSHGGYGGYALSKYENILVECFRIKSKSLYGNANDPFLEGSGGGCSANGLLTLGGAGGGVVYAGAQNLTLNGRISSDGTSPSTEAGKAKSGSGSGGSVQIYTRVIAGIGSISAMGGSTDKDGIGGPGGGGRVRINMIDWHNSESYPNSSLGWTGSISVAHGDTSLIKIPEDQGLVYLGDGSITSTPCLPGFFGPFCKKCPQGTFKSTLGPSECLKCTNKPVLAFYTNGVNPQSSPHCPYRCDLSKTPIDIDQNPICLSEAEYKMKYLGGWPGVLAIGMTLAFMLIFILLLILSRKKKTKNTGSMLSSKSFTDRGSESEYETSEDMSMDFEQKQQSLAKTEFAKEDLPFFEKRVYLCGENSYRRAWFISPDECLDLSREFDMAKYNLFLEEFERRVSYNWLQAFTLYFTKLLYYPLYFLLIHIYRAQKSKALSEIIPEAKIFKEKIDKKKTRYYLKFSASSDNTLTRLDILNYERSVLEWSNSPPYPVSIMIAGEGNFLFPFNIDPEDPLIELIGNSLKGKNSSLDNYSQISMEAEDEALSDDGQVLNGKEEFKLFLEQVNSKLRLIDFAKNSRDFVNHFFELADFLTVYNQSLFRENGIQVCIFYHKISIQKHTSTAGNSIVFLETDNKALLEKNLREAHHNRFLNRAINVKFSLNFSKIFVKECRSSTNDQLYYGHSFKIGAFKMFDEQMKSDGFDDIMALKHQVIMKNENETILMSNRMTKHAKTNTSEMMDSISSKLTRLFFKVNRWLGFVRALILSYRARRLNHHTLTALLFVLIVIDSVVFFSLCFGISNNLFKEIPSIYLFFPLSPFVSPILGIISVMSIQPTIVKIFLMYNAQSIFNHLIDFIITVSNRNDVNGPSMILFKFILILTKSLTIPVASAFVKFCDDTLDRKKRLEAK